MKKLSLLFLLALGLNTFNSCEDAYKITQDGEFNEEATFKTLEDMELFMLGTFEFASNVNEINFTSIITDEAALGSQNAGQNRDLYGFILSPDSQDGFADAIWLGQYTLIDRANRLLRGAARITPTTAELPYYNAIIAQARALRAYGHLQLMTYYSPDMSDPGGLGVIAMDHVADITEKPARNTNAEVFALIESDLEYAANNIIDYSIAVPVDDPTYAPNEKPWTFFTKNSINAFRARVYLYRKNYPLALQYANAAIAGTTGLTPGLPVPTGNVGSTSWNSAFYNATSTANLYRRMWADIDQGEIILSWERPPSQSGIGSSFYFNRTNLSGGPFMEMNRNLFNLLEQNNPVGATLNDGGSSDIRRYAFIDPTSKVDQPNYSTATAGNGYYDTDSNYKANDVLCIDKYPGIPGGDLVNDLKVFRVSEMYFIRAEALIAAGDLPGAAIAINDVRVARTFRGVAPVPLVYANATAAWADVLLERRKELCFEGHRYIDLKRLGTLANAGLDRYTRDCEIVPTCSIPTNDYRFTLPIGREELSGNPQVQQNPEYSN